MSEAKELLDRLYTLVGHAAPKELQDRIRAELAKPEPEPEPGPAAYILRNNELVFADKGIRLDPKVFNLTPLYTSPPTRKELSDNEIIEIWKQTESIEGSYILPITFARAIEKALREGI